MTKRTAQKCWHCRKQPRTKGPLCPPCYDLVTPNFRFNIGEIVYQYPFTIKDGAAWASACEVSDIGQYKLLGHIEPLRIADVTVHEVIFVNRPKPSLRYEWKRGKFGSDPNYLRGSAFRLSEEIVNSGALAELGVKFRGEWWTEWKPVQFETLFEVDL